MIACGTDPVSSYVNTVVPGNGCGFSSVSSVRSIFAVQGKPWFFGANALIFNRVDNKRIPLSSVDTSYGVDILTTRDAGQNAAGGVEVSSAATSAVVATLFSALTGDAHPARPQVRSSM